MSLEHLEVCRLCASSCENSVSIFGKTGSFDFVEKIKSYLHVEIKNSKDANNDPRMCNACYKKIINWNEYVEQVQKVQDIFMSLETISDSNVIMEKANILKRINILKKQNHIHNDKSVENPAKNKNEIEQMAKHFGEKKKKKSKKTSRNIYKKCNDYDFSEEDDIPLANQLECTKALNNRLKDKQTKKVKPKIKLKIKPLIDEKHTENITTSKEENINENMCMKGEKLQMGEDENSMDEDGTDSKEENQFNMAGVQSLFTWECLECHEPVKNWNALVKHCKDIHDSNASVQCVCGKYLQSRASIMKHRMKHTIGYGYKCEFENCNKTFHRQQLLDVHSLSHMPKELQPWMCCKCSRRFHTESLLKQHEKVHLPKEEKLIHPCEVCQKKFCSKSAVTAHIRAVHFGERPFVCDQCGHSFTSKGILHEHLTIHSDVYNFHCKDCNKSFKTKYRLKIHMDTHVETRYQCPVCALTLNTRRTLRMHLLVHKDDKAFQCTTCGKAFKRSKYLKNHYNLHTGKRPYTCPFCQRTFANGSNCRSHKRRMHPEELKMYEAAIAAGQQPVIFRIEDQKLTEKTAESQQQSGAEFLEDSNESKPDLSDMKQESRKLSDEDDKSVPLVPYNVKCANVDNLTSPENENVNKLKLLNPDSVPVNLQRNYKKIKNEDEELDGSMVINGGENIAANFAQIAFASQPQNIQYPVNNFYTFQSSGIPAFPGNPFLRQ